MIGWKRAAKISVLCVVMACGIILGGFPGTKLLEVLGLGCGLGAGFTLIAFATAIWRIHRQTESP